MTNNYFRKLIFLFSKIDNYDHDVFKNIYKLNKKNSLSWHLSGISCNPTLPILFYYFF